MRKLFTHSTSTLTSHQLETLMVPIYSPRGSNTREEEEAVMMNWIYYLQDIEGEYIHIIVTCIDKVESDCIIQTCVHV